MAANPPQPITYFGRDFANAEQEYATYVAWVDPNGNNMQGPCPCPSLFGERLTKYVDHPLDVLVLLAAVRAIRANENAQPQAAVDTTLTQQARDLEAEINNNPFANGTHNYQGVPLLFRRTLGAIRFMLTSINKADAVRANNLAQANLIAAQNQGAADAAALAQAQQIAALAQANLAAANAQHSQVIAERDLERAKVQNLMANLSLLGTLLQDPGVQAQMANGPLLMQSASVAPAGAGVALQVNDMDDNLDEEVNEQDDNLVEE